MLTVTSANSVPAADDLDADPEQIVALSEEVGALTRQRVADIRAITGRTSRTMVGYKAEAMTRDPYALDGDSSNDHLITTLWRNAPVNRPEATMVGVQYGSNSHWVDMVIWDPTHWLFSGTRLVDSFFACSRCFSASGNLPNCRSTLPSCHSTCTDAGANTWACDSAISADLL